MHLLNEPLRVRRPDPLSGRGQFLVWRSLFSCLSHTFLDVRPFGGDSRSQSRFIQNYTSHLLYIYSLLYNICPAAQRKRRRLQRPKKIQYVCSPYSVVLSPIFLCKRPVRYLESNGLGPAQVPTSPCLFLCPFLSSRRGPLPFLSLSGRPFLRRRLPRRPRSRGSRAPTCAGFPTYPLRSE